MLEDVGLDPNDEHESKHDPIGIGNLCGKAINTVRDADGQNSKGDIGATSPYNHKPFNDYTNYKVISIFKSPAQTIAKQTLTSTCSQ